MLNKEEKKNLVKKYGKSEKDTGSSCLPQQNRS